MTVCMRETERERCSEKRKVWRARKRRSEKEKRDQEKKRGKGERKIQ